MYKCTHDVVHVLGRGLILYTRKINQIWVIVSNLRTHFLIFIQLIHIVSTIYTRVYSQQYHITSQYLWVQKTTTQLWQTQKYTHAHRTLLHTDSYTYTLLQCCSVFVYKRDYWNNALCVYFIRTATAKSSKKTVPCTEKRTNRNSKDMRMRTTHDTTHNHTQATCRTHDRDLMVLACTLFSAGSRSKIHASCTVFQLPSSKFQVVCVGCACLSHNALCATTDIPTKYTATRAHKPQQYELPMRNARENWMCALCARSTTTTRVVAIAGEHVERWGVRCTVRVIKQSAAMPSAVSPI